MRMEEVGIAPLPLLNTDLEIEGTFPVSVEAFRRKILDFDSFLFASPEYNYSISDFSILMAMPAAIVSSGGVFGGGRAQYRLRQVGVYIDLHFINKPELFVQAFQPPRHSSLHQSSTVKVPPVIAGFHP